MASPRARRPDVPGIHQREGVCPFARILSPSVSGGCRPNRGIVGGHGIYSTAMRSGRFSARCGATARRPRVKRRWRAWVISCEHRAYAPPTADTGDYWAGTRAKLSERRCMNSVGMWPPRRNGCRRGLAVEGQARQTHRRLHLHDARHGRIRRVSQQKSQKPGVGLPIARVVTILSLATLA